MDPKHEIPDRPPRPALRQLRRAIYVYRSTDERHRDIYTCGCAGKGVDQDGNLADREYQHSRSHPEAEKGRHFYHPFSERIWAYHLEGWSNAGVMWAEHVLYTRLGWRLKLLIESVFKADEGADVAVIARKVIPVIERRRRLGGWVLEHPSAQ